MQHDTMLRTPVSITLKIIENYVIVKVFSRLYFICFSPSYNDVIRIK